MCEKRKPVAGGGVALGLQSYQYEEITKDKYLSQHKSVGRHAKMTHFRW